MKRKIETSLEWDLKKFDASLGQYIGPKTNLPVKNGQSPLHINEVTASSSRGETEGHIYVQLNRSIDSCPPFSDPAESALLRLYHAWYSRQIVSGSCGTGPTHFSINFELKRSENSFAWAAMSRVITILKDLDITRVQLTNPKIMQRPYVWIPKDKSWKNELGLKEFGWVELGIYMGAKFSLGKNPPVLHKDLS